MTLKELKKELNKNETIKQLIKDFNDITENKTIEIKTQRQANYYKIGLYILEQKDDYYVHNFKEIEFYKLEKKQKLENCQIANKLFLELEKKIINRLEQLISLEIENN